MDNRQEHLNAFATVREGMAFLLLLLTAEWLERTIPEKPNNRMQRYRATAKGLQALKMKGA